MKKMFFITLFSVSIALNAYSPNNGNRSYASITIPFPTYCIYPNVSAFLQAGTFTNGEVFWVGVDAPTKSLNVDAEFGTATVDPNNPCHYTGSVTHNGYVFFFSYYISSDGIITSTLITII